MYSLIKNEIYKIWKMKAFRVVLIFHMINVLMEPMFLNATTIRENWKTWGFMSPFLTTSEYCSLSFFCFVFVAAIYTLDDWLDGTFRNILCTGISRGKVYMARIIAMQSMISLIWILTIFLSSISKVRMYGFDAKGKLFEQYGLKVFVYVIATLVLLWMFVSLVHMIAWILKDTRITSIICCITVCVVAFLQKAEWGKLSVVMGKGTIGTMNSLLNYAVEDCIVTRSFFMEVFPFGCVLILTVFLGYRLFVREEQW